MELWALIHGLRLAWEKGIRRLVAKVDSLLVFSWVTKGDSTKNKHAILIRECLELSKRNWSINIHRVNRVGNCTTNFLTKSSLEL